MDVGKIGWVGIDPNGYCPSRCWFCPRGWMPNPPAANREMSLDEIKRLLDQCVPSDPVFIPGFNFVSFTHYNEILLYSRVKELFDEVARRKMRSILCTNGIPLKEQHLAWILQHAVAGTFFKIRFNIPAGDAKTYKLMTGMPAATFETMIERASRLAASIPEKLRKSIFDVEVNLPDPSRPSEPFLLPRAQPLDRETVWKQVDLLKERFPGCNVYRQRPNDRGGLLARLGVMSDYHQCVKPHEEVAGCKIDQLRWLHINSLSQAFLCCSDYEFAYAYADLHTQSIHDAWLSPAHEEVIMRAQSTLCRTCIYASTKS